MGDADRRAIAGGTPEAVLVERAGRAVARHAVRMLGGTYGRRVVIVCGKGNNGADGLVAARHLRARGAGVDVFSLDGDLDPSKLQRALERAHLAVDAMFGTGFRGALDDAAAGVAVAFAATGVTVLAVDIPSGVDGATGEARGPAVRASETVCFAALKPGLLFEPGRTCAGRVRVVDIGIDAGTPPLCVLDAADLSLPRRDAAAHKWSAGALVVGGSVGMFGAPLMTSQAAARAGAGMVVCALPGVEAAARASTAEIVTRALPATSTGALDADAAAEVLKDADRFGAVAIGPGLGRADATQHAVRSIVAECPVPVVVDADALNALAGDPAPLAARAAAERPPAILTPHAGEYARLAGVPIGSDRIAAARSLAARTRAIVLLKGPGTVVADPDGRAVVNRTDGPALAAAGTGDVLTGIIAGLLARGVPPAAAAATGAYVHGRAATAAGTGDDLVAVDLIGALHPTLEALRSGRDPWED
ncbi:MAG TPA: NAD(P)H-hydrate dehydratase [Acidimicrobiia bacterium]|nr:NAD(P)H-hydrate dehydratase [Acidimicrobiia bacterium]